MIESSSSPLARDTANYLAPTPLGFLDRAAAIYFGNETSRRLPVDLAHVFNQGPVCHSFQPEQRNLASRIGNINRRFDHTPQAMLARIDRQS